MDGPIQLVRSRSNSVSSITSNTTQQLAYWSLQEKRSLLWSLHECNLKILQSTYVRISAECQDREDFAEVVKNLKDEVVRLRLWGNEVDVKAMLVVERSKELRSAVTVLLQEIASILLNRNLARKDIKVCMLTIAGACIRPPPNWRSHEYQKLRELHDKVKTITNVQTDQGRHDEPNAGSASPDFELFGLEELILDLRCYTSTLMDLVPVIEHTKDVLAKYVFRQHVSRVQQMRTSAPSARNDKTEVEALEKTGEPSQRISGPDSQRPFSDTSSTVPLIHTTGNADNIKGTSRKIVPPESRKPSSIVSDNTPPRLNTAPIDASREALYENGPLDLQKPSFKFPVTRPTVIAAENPYTRKDEKDTEAPRKSDESSQSGVPPDSEEKIEESNHQIGQPNSPKPSLKNHRHTPPLDNPENPDQAVDSSAQGLATGTQGPWYPDPDELLLGVCDLCGISYDDCVHSLTTTYIAPPFTTDTFLQHPEWPAYSDSSSLYPLPRYLPSFEASLSPIVGYEPPLRHQTASEPSIVQEHVEDTYTLGDRLLQAHIEGTYTPGDRAPATESRRTPKTRRRQAPRLGGFPCTIEGCEKAFNRSCDLKYVVPHPLPLPQTHNGLPN